MKLTIIWRDNTEYAREVITWITDFERETGRKVESKDPDTIEGDMYARARDIVEYPTIVAADNDGKVLKMWSGTPMPRFDEVAFYS